MKPVHTFSPYFFKFHLNIILPLTLHPPSASAYYKFEECVEVVYISTITPFWMILLLYFNRFRINHKPTEITYPSVSSLKLKAKIPVKLVQYLRTEYRL
jgi:hypothetical protein